MTKFFIFFIFMHFVQFLIYLTVLVGPDSYSYHTTCKQSAPGLDSMQVLCHKGVAIATLLVFHKSAGSGVK